MPETKDAEFPIVGGGPDPIPGSSDLVAVVQDAYWWWLGQPKPARILISTQGDFWDVIALRAYGRQRGNEHLMYRLLEENYDLRDVVIFPAGIPIIVPEIAVATEIPLVPWKTATVGPAP